MRTSHKSSCKLKVSITYRNSRNFTRRSHPLNRSMEGDAVGFDELTCLYAFTCLLTVKYYEEKYLYERRCGGPFIAKKNWEKNIPSPFPPITFGGLPSKYMQNLSWNVKSGDLKIDAWHEAYTKVASHHSKHGSRHDSIRFDALPC